MEFNGCFDQWHPSKPEKLHRRDQKSQNQQTHFVGPFRIGLRRNTPPDNFDLRKILPDFFTDWDCLFQLWAGHHCASEILKITCFQQC
jgi:hypothetical protein